MAAITTINTTFLIHVSCLHYTIDNGNEDDDAWIIDAESSCLRALADLYSTTILFLYRNITVLQEYYCFTGIRLSYSTNYRPADLRWV